MEMARDGKSVAEIMSAGREILGSERRDGRRAGDGLDDPGRADIPRRLETGHDPRSDPLMIGDRSILIPCNSWEAENGSGRIFH